MRVVGRILWVDWACKEENQSCAYRVSLASAVFCVSGNPSWWAHLISETSWPSGISPFGQIPHSWWPWWSTLSANHFLALQPGRLSAGLSQAKKSHCLQAYTLSVWFRSSSWICNNSRCRFCFIVEEGNQTGSEPCPSWGMGNRIRLGTLSICWTFRTAGYWSWWRVWKSYISTFCARHAGLLQSSSQSVQTSALTGCSHCPDDEQDSFVLMSYRGFTHLLDFDFS